MNEQVFLDKMKGLMDNENLTMDTTLSDLEEWDSVSVLGFVSIALDCGKELNLKQIGACSTIGDLYALLK